MVLLKIRIPFSAACPTETCLRKTGGSFFGVEITVALAQRMIVQNPGYARLNDATGSGDNGRPLDFAA
jgi:hypothetical protein